MTKGADAGAGTVNFIFVLLVRVRMRLALIPGCGVRSMAVRLQVRVRYTALRGILAINLDLYLEHIRDIHETISSLVFSY